MAHVSHATLVSPWRASGLRLFACRGNSPRLLRYCAVSANLVPDFPRIGEPLRTWLDKGVPQLPGFNGEDLTRLLFPDLQTFTTYTIGGALLVAFVYWEGGIILHELQERQARARRAEGEAGARPPNRPLTPQQQMLYERKQGLAWLAIVTAMAIWSTGVVNKVNPFMP